ncbi:MAG: transporter permease [Paenibacillaceae bacterium]|jgi:putative aldouronate transport system permease protein|nr:transporter permease [Paenibacillaceae bacterium]
MVKSNEERWFSIFVNAVLAAIGITILFPLLYVVSISLTPYTEVLKNGGFVFLPKSITLQAYAELLRNAAIPQSLGVTVLVTLVGTILNVGLTTLLAYPLSRKMLPGRRVLIMMVVFTMLFNGGLIPTYMVVRATGLLDTLWALIIPGVISSYNVLIVKTFIDKLPEELFESARIDGASEFRLFCQILIPLSVPVMITIGLFCAVGHWNQYFAAIMYLTDRRWYPLQVTIREILMQSQMPSLDVDQTLPTLTVQMSSIVFGSLPIVAIYPFLQKHLIKGMTIGAVKG